MAINTAHIMLSFPKRLNRLPNWVIASIISTGILIASIAYASPSLIVYPMGDAYIHFVYARNLAELGEFNFNPGLREGIGTSSPLWVLMLSAFSALGVSPLVSARFLGVGCLIGAGITFHILLDWILENLRVRFHRFLSGFAVLLGVTSGNMIWIANSGMETMLFLVLTLVSLYLYRHQRWALTGLFLGLATLARIEGAVLVATIFLVECFRRRSIQPSLVKMMAAFALILFPWVIYLLMREGSLLPTSFQGKQLTAATVEQTVIARYPESEWILSFPPLQYLSICFGYLFLYLFGGTSLPGPSFQIPGLWQGDVTSLPLTSVGLVIFFTVLITRQFQRGFQRYKMEISLSKDHFNVLAVLAMWVLFHNSAYAFFLPQIGSASRYIPVNHLLFWAGIILASATLTKRSVRIASFLLVIVAFASSSIFWQRIYRANIQYMLDVRIPSAQYVDSHCDPNLPVGSIDLGPLRYFAQQQVLDLYGFVNRDIARIMETENGYVNYLREKSVQCLHVFSPVNNVGLDVLEITNISGNSRIEIYRIAIFSIPLNEWKEGIAGVGNYLPAISIYRINPPP